MNRKNLIGNQTLFISILLGGILPSLCFAQLSISSLGTSSTIDFDNTVSGVNSGEFDGSGFASSPSDGQLDCDGIIATGLSDGDGAFGTDKTSGDFARGTDSASPHNGVGTGGIYAFEVSSGNYAIGVQPGGSDFTPGSFILKIYDCFSKLTSHFILLLSQYYRNVYIYKPFTSRSFNSERYIICTEFKGISIEELNNFNYKLNKYEHYLSTLKMIKNTDIIENQIIVLLR